MELGFEGRVFSGIGKGKYYVGHPEYQKRFEKVLGYRPYPGTLNLKLEDRVVMDKMLKLRSMGGKRIPAFSADGEPMSAVSCFDGTLNGERISVLFIDVTHYNESVTELISSSYLRGEFGLSDGDLVSFTVWSDWTRQGRQ